ncbi:hypothetical protein K8O68_07195 [Salipaludibacillus sp. CUR1]|uniref:hypothetical protein n=1 Tax=Salipaludibacillus sp. CUR1 TaxID=2820003 RepID=UPI001E5F6905|nr:hypothetical protein [Salipaludibacillus sp. CUR1]MCE7792210.1 hypothetical protein [Salipaludibacillus sp. CUR1]
MFENDTEYMTSAYKMLYKIETALKYRIQSTYSSIYGLSWEPYLKSHKSFDKMFYQDIIRVYKQDKYLQSYFSKEELTSLDNLRFIRNEVAHMKVITPKEHELLLTCYNFVVKRKDSLFVNMDDNE